MSKKIKVQQEWTEQDFNDFFSDYICGPTEDHIHEKAHDYYSRLRHRGYTNHQAEDMAFGYKEALLEILKQR